MKKLILSLCLVLGGVVLVNAQNQDTTQTLPQTQTQQTTPADDQNRAQIQVGELPQAVKTSLESQDYSGWTVSTAYRSTQANSSDETKSMEVYIVELKNGPDIKTVRFDRDGNKLDDEKEKDGQK